jgi:glutamate--cysteine ligase
MFKISNQFNNLILDRKVLNLSKGRVGIEKESLRISDSKISKKNHYSRLGSALCNKYITTDFSEALLEFITPPSTRNNKTYEFLEDIHSFASSRIDDEILWPFSMPLETSSENDIPIADYGSSNKARFKTIYRNGLSNRYGRRMQAISGLHFNYSLAEDIWDNNFLSDDSEKISNEKSLVYFGGIRNLKRMNWLILYLFGASPIVPKSLISNDYDGLESLDSNYYYLPYSTSLRMSDIGYQTNYQNDLQISPNSLDEYLSDLLSATNKESSVFRKIPLKNNNEYSQLNANILQIEDEYYSSSRPKSTSLENKRMLLKLKTGGVNYIEYRSLDINPFHKSGIDIDTIYFLELFILYCCIKDSPLMTKDEQKDSKLNTLKVSKEGRRKDIILLRNLQKVTLKDWSKNIFDEMIEIAENLDESSKYLGAIEKSKTLIESPDNTPSGLILDMVLSGKLSIEEMGNEIAKKNKDAFLERNINSFLVLDNEVEESIDRQKKLETKSSKLFEDYLEDYLASY